MNAQKDIVRWAMIFMVMLITACGGNGVKEEGAFGEKDRIKMMKQLETRKQYHLRIIDDKKRAIGILESNLEQARAQSVKDKIQKEINAHKIAMDRAERNVANQDSIIQRLERAGP